MSLHNYEFDAVHNKPDYFAELKQQRAREALEIKKFKKWFFNNIKIGEEFSLFELKNKNRQIYSQNGFWSLIEEGFVCREYPSKRLK